MSNLYVINPSNEYLLDLSINDLYGELFEYSPGSEGFLGSKGGRSREGEKLFEKYKKSASELLCEEWEACRKIQKYQNRIDLVNNVASVLSPLAPYLPPIIATIIIIKKGITKFCSCES